MSERGYGVTVVHAAGVESDTPLMRMPMLTARYLRRRLLGGYRPDAWFTLNPRVSIAWVPSPAARYVPDADVVVATAWQTAEWIATYPPVKGKKLYLIQHLESWSGPADRVLATWRLPLRKIVIAEWLHNFAATLGEAADYVPNGLDFATFGLDRPPELRDPDTALMLYHTAEWKGSCDGLQALRLAKIERPALHATLFGIPERPRDLPGWIEYRRMPEQGVLRQLYNGAAVFLAPSWSEGCAAPPGEAMICGSAVVATDIGGHREYAIPDKTALLAPAKDPPALARALVRMIRDDALRLQLAGAGHAFIRRFTWERAADAFEHAVRAALGPRRS
ncbi:MAG TPA: glycosyltransferase family 4 protein [bacterium]|nr:glycosyltransferase family 4 protein [bacterium]